MMNNVENKLLPKRTSCKFLCTVCGIFIADAHLVKSAKTQTAPGIKQFYFSPTHGTYIPVTSAQHGKLKIPQFTMVKCYR